MQEPKRTEGVRRRVPLTRERVLDAAIVLADEGGIEHVTMRRLGNRLGVEAMALYKHLANKNEILDGIVEAVIGEIVIPHPDTQWREAMQQRAISARSVLRRHPWVIGLMESRGMPGPVTLKYVDSVIGSLRSGGFSLELAGHAFWLLDSFVYGQVIQEVSLSGPSSEALTPANDDFGADDQAGHYSHLLEMASEAEAIGFTVDGEFRFGLELILDALEAAR